MTCKNGGKYCLLQEYFIHVKWNSWKGPSSKLYLFKYLLTGTLYRKVNVHLIPKLGSCPSWIKFIEMWFASFFFFFSHFNIPDGRDTHTHTLVTMAHKSIDSGGGEVSLNRTYKNQRQVSVWKAYYVIITFVGNKEAMFLPTQRSHLG